MVLDLGVVAVGLVAYEFIIQARYRPVTAEAQHVYTRILPLYGTAMIATRGAWITNTDSKVLNNSKALLRQWSSCCKPA